MTTPHLVEPPSLAAQFVDVELSPMSRHRHRFTAMRIAGRNQQDLSARLLAFIHQEEELNACPEWSVKEWNGEVVLAARCEIIGITWVVRERIPISVIEQHRLQGEDVDTWLAEKWLPAAAKSAQRKLERAVARFVLYGAK